MIRASSGGVRNARDRSRGRAARTLRVHRLRRPGGRPARGVRAELLWNPIRVRPNPFTGQTTLIFGLLRETIVSLSTFDASGRRLGGEVREVRFQAGWHTLKIGDAGWPQGVYFYRLQADQHVRTGKIILRD